MLLLTMLVVGLIGPCAAVEVRLSDGTMLTGDTLPEPSGDLYVKTMFGKVPVTRADIAAIDGIPYHTATEPTDRVEPSAPQPMSPAETPAAHQDRDSGGDAHPVRSEKRSGASNVAPDESESFTPPTDQSVSSEPEPPQPHADRAHPPAETTDSLQAAGTPLAEPPATGVETVSIALPGTVESGKELLSRIQALCDSLARVVPAEAKSARVAVLPFESGDGNAAEGRAVAEYLVAGLQSRDLFTLVDRLDFQKVLGEIALSQSGAMDQSRAVDVGRMMAAEYVCTGTIAEVMGLRTVAVRLVHVETGEVAVSAVLRVGETALGDIAQELLSERSRVTSSVFRSLVLPGWGQMYSERTGRGLVSLVCCVGGLAATVVSAIDRSADYSAYTSYGSRMEQPAFFDSLNAATSDGRTYAQHLDDALDEHESLYDEYSAAHGRTLILAGASAGLWALNLIDAAVAGAQNKKRLKLYFGAVPASNACLYAGVSLQWRAR